MSLRHGLLLANALLVSALLAWLTNTTGVLQGDAVIYLDRLEPILDGSLPYRDAPFEHLPVSLVPLLAAAVIDAVPAVSFLLAIAIVNAALLAAILGLCGRLAVTLDDAGVPGRWLLVAAPLFPIVLFRLDPISVMLAALALLTLLRGQAVRSVVATWIGIAARGWLVVLALAHWRNGWRKLTIATLAGTGVMALMLVNADGFTGGRSFTGVQIETIVGSLILLASHLAEGPAITETAGSLYVGSGAWPAVGNAVIGAAVTGIAVWQLRRSSGSIPLLAAAVYGLLLISPLLSAQMLLWPTVFAACVASAPHRLIAVTGAATTALLVWWHPAAEWWAAALVLRNVLLAATLPLLATRAALADQPSISRRNLPV